MPSRASIVAGAALLALSGVLGVAIGQADPAQVAAQAGDGEKSHRDAVKAQVDALYDVISGPAGERDWERFRSLFAEGARLSAIFHRPDGNGGLASMTPQEYIERSAPSFLRNAFYETEVASRIEMYAGIAHVWTTYEARREPNGEPFMRGINSVQLVKVPGEQNWKILAVTWDSESSGVKIPAEYSGK